MNTLTNDDNAVNTPKPLQRITHNPQVMEGRACIRGMRVTVGMIVGQICDGRSIGNVLDDFPYLERDWWNRSG